MLISGSGLFIVIAALAFDALIGDPDWLWRRIGHPVSLIGALIDLLDRKFNHDNHSPEQRKSEGINSTAILVVIAIAVGALIQFVVQTLPIGNVILALIASIFIAQRSLYQHVADVRAAFAEGGLPAAREAVSMIVGRDPEKLDEAGVCRAAIESCAENFADGVVAPVFWYALFGFPGLLLYKTANTMDSMIGHLDEKHRDFGLIAARLDDLLNLIPARLAAVQLVFATLFLPGGHPFKAWLTMWRDHGHHRSPNSGWPEAAMAGGLDLALAGPRQYPGYVAQEKWIGDGRARAGIGDIHRALFVMAVACLLNFGMVVLCLTLEYLR